MVPSALFVAFDVYPASGCIDPSKPVDKSVFVTALVVSDVPEAAFGDDSASMMWVESSDDESKNP
ncbi:hypothetical protein B602_0309 [Chlamydia psittaci M56]|nr:hypothetical protein B602_0309 [Chlamydia psittaci M56]